MPDTKTHKEFASTLNRFKNFSWADHVRILEARYVPPAPHSLWDEVVRVFLILRAAFREEALLLNSLSGRYQPDLIAAALLGLVPSRWHATTVMMGEMWQADAGLKYQIERWIIKLANRAIKHYIVLSTDEVEFFPKFWGLGAASVSFCPYFYSFTDQDLASPAPPQGAYIFSGGNSHRDYETLIEVARCMPAERFVIATHLLDSHPRVPSNVTAGQMDHAEFVSLMRGAKAVILPIKKALTRASGQQTYLNAMLLKKPTIVNDGFGVRDHLTHRQNAFIVDGSVESYIEALTWVLQPQNEAALHDICADAHKTVLEQFTPDLHVRRILAIMDEVLACRKSP